MLLQEGGADVDARDSNGETPLMWLARFSSTYDHEDVKAARSLLVWAGARTSGVFNNIDLSPLMIACAAGCARFARF